MSSEMVLNYELDEYYRKLCTTVGGEEKHEE